MRKVLLTGNSDLYAQLRNNTPLLFSHTANSEPISGGEEFQIANWRFEIQIKAEPVTHKAKRPLTEGSGCKFVEWKMGEGYDARGREP
jgi:hypothetical protein